MRLFIVLTLLGIGLFAYILLNINLKMKDVGSQVNDVKAMQAKQKAELEKLSKASRSNRDSSSGFAKTPLYQEVDSKKFQNFFNESVITEGSIYRWNKSHLTFSIDKLASRRLSEAKVRRAFEHWQRKSRIFTFSQEKDPNKADILIKVATASEKSRMGEAGPDKALPGAIFDIGGHKVREFIVYHANVTIAEEFFDYKKMDEYVKAGTDHGFQTLVHELAHVLGIMGHSPNVGDCMYFQAHSSGKACDVITREVNTLAMIYGRPDLLNRGFYAQKSF
jgi:hypothetical protein